IKAQQRHVKIWGTKNLSSLSKLRQERAKHLRGRQDARFCDNSRSQDSLAGGNAPRVNVWLVDPGLWGLGHSDA
ncbi:MAG: hypothetical protein JXB07_18630, partial [Anaerolineae bacterium]|nr:hypothetical protein [Anaerolineae bacterium]